jgi:hypothetical protein
MLFNLWCQRKNSKNTEKYSYKFVGRCMKCHKRLRVRKYIFHFLLQHSLKQLAIVYTNHEAATPACRDNPSWYSMHISIRSKSFMVFLFLNFIFHQFSLLALLRVDFYVILNIIVSIDNIRILIFRTISYLDGFAGGDMILPPPLTAVSLLNYTRVIINSLKLLACNSDKTCSQ